MPSRVDTELETLIRARYPIIYVVSWEEERVEDALRAVARERGKKLHVWTVTLGFARPGGQKDNTTRDPLAALDYVLNSPDQAIFLLKDFHSFIGDFNVTRRLRDLTPTLKNSFKSLIILSPILKLPAELEKEITVLDYGLPTYEELGHLLDDIIRTVRDTPGVNTSLAPEEREAVLKAAQGLTAMEAENVFAKSIVEKRGFDIDVILSEKEQIIRKSGILEYYPASDSFKNVGGLDLLKDWMDKRTTSFTDRARDFGLPEPKGILLLGVQGCGKCFERDTPILMFNGEVKTVQDVQAGELVMGPDSCPRRVLSTTRGKGDMFRVTPTKGMPYVVNADHILTLRMSGARRTYKQADANGIVNLTVCDYLKQSASFKQRAMGYRTGVEFAPSSVPLDPYFLGVWLGDGSEKSPAVTTADDAIVQHVAQTAASHGLNVRRADKNQANRSATYYLSAGNQGRTVNPVLNILRNLNLLGNKHIPFLYRVNDREVRLRLLAGIIDTDGCQQGNDYEIIQKRKQLSEDIAFVARSLGLAAYVHPCRKSCLVNGLRVEGTYYRIHISGDTDMIPVRLHPKRALPRRQRKNVLNTGQRVESVGPGEFYGFAVDGDHRFLLGDFTVVHNSLSAKAIGAQWRLPLLRLDIGKVFAGLVGASEENMRKALRVAESVSPAILWLDELEKGLSGTQSSGSSDGGTTARVFSTFLTWLQEKTVPVFVVATANQVEMLPPELLRKGRFDEIFFIDLPARQERAEIFAIHLRKRKRDPAKFDLNALADATPGYSGAEIEQVVVEALYDAFDTARDTGDTARDLTMEDLLKACRASVPLSMTMREKIAYLRDWAQTRARQASSATPESLEEQMASFLEARAQEEAFRRKQEAANQLKAASAAEPAPVNTLPAETAPAVAEEPES